MKALILAPQPFFSPRGTPLSVYYRTLVTAELGIEADLLTYGQGQDVDIPGVAIVRIPRFRVLGDVRIGPSVLKLFLDLVLTLRAANMLRRNQYDFVHAHEEAVFVALLLRRFFAFKLVYDMHSSLPEQLSNFRYANHRLLVAAFRKLERASLQAADAVITISPGLSKHARSLITEGDKVVLIENSILEEVSSATEPTVQTSTRLPRCFALICGLEPGLCVLAWASVDRACLETSLAARRSTRRRHASSGLRRQR